MWDSTRSFNDGLNNNVVAHAETQAARNPRLQGTIRNTRVGMRVEAPGFGGIRSSGVLEFDLFGNQPNINGGGGSPAQPSGPGATTESAYFNNAGLRVRHAYTKLESPIVDVLAGQTYHVTGTGDADQYTGMTAGATLPNAYQLPPDTPVLATGTAAPQGGQGIQPLVGLPYTPNPGLVAFDPHGRLYTINWQTFVVGIQYYLPPTGRVFTAANYSHGKSSNIASLFHPGDTTQLWVNSRGVFSSARR